MVIRRLVLFSFFVSTFVWSISARALPAPNATSTNPPLRGAISPPATITNYPFTNMNPANETFVTAVPVPSIPSAPPAASNDSPANRQSGSLIGVGILTDPSSGKVVDMEFTGDFPWEMKNPFKPVDDKQLMIYCRWITQALKCHLAPATEPAPAP